MKAVLNVETYLHYSQDSRGTLPGLWPGLLRNLHLSDYGRVARLFERSRPAASFKCVSSETSNHEMRFHRHGSKNELITSDCPSPVPGSSRTGLNAELKPDIALACNLRGTSRLSRPLAAASFLPHDNRMPSRKPHGPCSGSQLPRRGPPP